MTGLNYPTQWSEPLTFFAHRPVMALHSIALRHSHTALAPLPWVHSTPEPMLLGTSLYLFHHRRKVPFGRRKCGPHSDGHKRTSQSMPSKKLDGHVYPPSPWLVCPHVTVPRHSLQTNSERTIAHSISHLPHSIKFKEFKYLIQLDGYRNIVVRRQCPKLCAHLFYELRPQFLRPSVTAFQVFIAIIPKERSKGVMNPAYMWRHDDGGRQKGTTMSESPPTSQVTHGSFECWSDCLNGSLCIILTLNINILCQLNFEIFRISPGDCIEGRTYGSSAYHPITAWTECTDGCGVYV